MSNLYRSTKPSVSVVEEISSITDTIRRISAELDPLQLERDTLAIRRNESQRFLTRSRGARWNK